MASHDERVPDHPLIRIEHRDDPLSVMREDDARRRSSAYPTLMWGAPVFGYVEEAEGRWRILRLDADVPQDARDGLASHLRRRHSRTPPTEEHAAARAALKAAYDLLDEQVVDELTVAGHRYRIVRAQTFIRMGPDGPEPPRPTDPDPRRADPTDDDMPHMEGFVIDPGAATGLADALVRLGMTSACPISESIAEDVRADSRRAVITHPNVVLLPIGYTVGEYVAGSWRPRASTYPTPQAARDAGSFSIVELLPGDDTDVEQFIAAYGRARAAHRPPRTDDFEVRGGPCRVSRVETFVRVGPHGPEGPRPSDPDPYPPPARHVDQLREQGLVD